MLSERVKKHLIDTGLYDETDDISYQSVMLDLGIKLDKPFAQFNIYTKSVTFTGRLMKYIMYVGLLLTLHISNK